MVNATSMAFVTTAENFAANALETAKKANLLVVGRQVLTEWIERGAVPDGLTAPSRPAGEQDAGSSTRVARHALQRTRRGRTDRVDPSSWRIRLIAAYDHGRSAPPQRGQASNASTTATAVIKAALRSHPVDRLRVHVVVAHEGPNARTTCSPRMTPTRLYTLIQNAVQHRPAAPLPVGHHRRRMAGGSTLLTVLFA
jgi:hypothetical protein